MVEAFGPSCNRNILAVRVDESGVVLGCERTAVGPPNAFILGAETASWSRGPPELGLLTVLTPLTETELRVVRPSDVPHGGDRALVGGSVG